MLKITTSNGDTLIHTDQKSDAITGTSYDGSQYLVHAGEWGKHKYIRKEGNRYIYPEDLQKNPQGRSRGASLGSMNVHKRGSGTGTGSVGSSTRPAKSSSVPSRMGESTGNMAVDAQRKEGTNAKMLVKSRLQNGKSNWDGSLKENDDFDAAINTARSINKAAKNWKNTEKELGQNQRETIAKIGTKLNSDVSKLTDNEKQIFAKNEAITNKALKDRDLLGKEFKNTITDKEMEANQKTAERARKQKQPTQQRKSAHAGYEADKKNFPEGGSTEELERQKKKTAARKRAKERAANREEYLKKISKRKIKHPGSPEYRAELHSNSKKNRY